MRNCIARNRTVFDIKTVYFYLTELFEIELFICIKSKDRLIGLMCRVFTNDPGDLGSIEGRVTPKTLKMVLCTSAI